MQFLFFHNYIRNKVVKFLILLPPLLIFDIEKNQLQRQFLIFALCVIVHKSPTHAQLKLRTTRNAPRDLKDINIQPLPS